MNGQLRFYTRRRKKILGFAPGAGVSSSATNRRERVHFEQFWNDFLGLRTLRTLQVCATYSQLILADVFGPFSINLGHSHPRSTQENLKCRRSIRLHIQTGNYPGNYHLQNPGLFERTGQLPFPFGLDDLGLRDTGLFLPKHTVGRQLG
jgi:hypothetical protein